jgi:hypothetical protein
MEQAAADPNGAPQTGPGNGKPQAQSNAEKKQMANRRQMAQGQPTGNMDQASQPQSQGE